MTARSGTMRTAVFDLDGTLADTASDPIAAANATLARRGTVTCSTRRFHPGRRFCRRPRHAAGGARACGVVPEPQTTRFYPRLLDLYARNIARETRFYPGDGAGAGPAAHAAGWRLAITNKPVALAERWRRNSSVRDRFAALLGADSTGGAQARPDPSQRDDPARRRQPGPRGPDRRHHDRPRHRARRRRALRARHLQARRLASRRMGQSPARCYSDLPPCSTGLVPAA